MPVGKSIGRVALAPVVDLVVLTEQNCSR
jgi:hypothetical protein